MTDLFLSDPKYPDMPVVTEHDHALWYSSIWTPEIEIFDVQSDTVNDMWNIPRSWNGLISEKLREMKNSGRY